MKDDNISKEKYRHNHRERVMGFIHVSLLFLLTTGLCCVLLFWLSGAGTAGARKDFAIAKMTRIRGFRSIQTKQAVIADSIYARIGHFNPSVQAVYEEDDIRFYLNGLKDVYEKNSYDKRYKIFSQVSDFYGMWLSDRKEVWSRRQNITGFKKNLEDCRIGLRRNNEELTNRQR